MRVLARRAFFVLNLLTLGCQQRSELPGNYRVLRHSLHEVFVAQEIWSEAEPRIPPKVVSLWSDSRYIVAKRQVLVRRSPQNPSDSYLVPGAIPLEIWIIDSVTRRCNEPITEEQLSLWAANTGLPSPLPF